MTVAVVGTEPRLLVDARQDPGVTLLAPVGRRPIDQYGDAVAKPDEEVDVREQPEEPRGETAELEVAHRRGEVDHRRIAPDGGQVAVVAVAEGQRLLPADAPQDVAGRPAPHLLGARGDTGHRARF